MAAAATPYSSYLQFLASQNPQAMQDSALTPPNSILNPPNSPYGGVYGNAPNPTSVANPTWSNVGQGGTGNDENDILQQAYNNQQYINQQGQQLNQEAQGELAYYGPQQATYDQAQAQALKQLQQNPGYTPGQAGQINVDYSQYNTTPGALNSQFLTQGEQGGIAGDPNRPLQAAYTGTQNEGDQLNSYGANLGAQVGAYGENLSGQVGNYSNYTKGALDTLNTGTGAAVGKLASGLQGAQSGFSKLDTAVNNPGLAFDPNNTERQLTDADVQEMETAAGTTVGNSYRTAEDQLQRNAAAAGNTSPLAIAAANARLQTQEASQQGEAETNAEIAAKQAQQTRAAQIEAQREGAVQTATGLRAGAATTEQSQAQAAAALAGTQGLSAAELAGVQGIGAAENVGQAGINAANTYGQAGINAANQYGQTAINQQDTMTNQQYGAQATAEQLAAARAAQLAGNRQATQANVNQTQYNQGTGSAQLTSGGAQAVGNQQIAGQNAYRAGVAGQQQYNQQGGQQAMGAQQSAYGTQTGGLNASTAAAGNMKTNQPSVIKDITSMAGAFLSAKGDVVTEPEVHLIAEKGPEWVGPVGTPYNKRKQQPQDGDPAFQYSEAA